MKKRLDVLICEQNPGLTRNRAQTLIMSGAVYVDSQKETKSGTMFPENTIPEIRENNFRYVSRGGLKLEKAIDVFGIDLNNKICMDIGASTGGFTDCMLQNGASRVYSVDVGKGQLDWKLRQNKNVIVMEKTNIRFVKPEDIPETVNFVSIDVSFISLTLVVPVAISLLDEEKNIVMLIKPQFEAGREKVGKKGVIKDKNVHFDVIKKITDFVTASGLQVKGLDFSPVKGPEGNIEYLLFAGMECNDTGFGDLIISKVVDGAHEKLNKCTCSQSCAVP